MTPSSTKQACASKVIRYAEGEWERLELLWRTIAFPAVSDIPFSLQNLSAKEVLSHNDKTTSAATPN